MSNNQARTANDIDRHVGRRIRERRIMLGLTQHQLAEKIDRTYQQVHKYEKGANRIMAGLLAEVAAILGVSVSYFFEGVDGPKPKLQATRRLMLELAKSFIGIPREDHQRLIVSTAQCLKHR